MGDRTNLDFIWPIPIKTVTVETGACLYYLLNNNEYLERLTRTGPKRLHVL